MTDDPSARRYARADVPRAARPIRLGTLLFTMVEPHPGQALAYNRWYERDHFYSGCMVGPDTLAGNRYVATRACKALRYGSGGPGPADLAKGSYLALYWILDGRHQAWDAWAFEQVKALHAGGRMFAARDHVLTGFYAYAAELNAPGSTMPIELALDRAYAGLCVFLIALAPGRTAGDIESFLRARDFPGDAGLIAVPMPMEARPGGVAESSGGHVALLSFSIEDPRAVWNARYADLGDAVAAAGLGTVTFASPFLATVFGTDTYTDDL